MRQVRLPRDTQASGRSASLSELPFAIADRVGRLRPSHRDPQAFHVEKDAIERELRRLARRGARSLA